MNPENKVLNGKSNKGTQTKGSSDNNLVGKQRYNLPLPRDISNSVRGPITTFEFCKVFQPANEPCGLTIVHEQITEEETEPKNSEIEKKRYRYCKEILKPYLKNYPPDCPDLTENFIKNSIESAEEETPDQQPCFSFEGFRISGLDPSGLLQDSSEGSNIAKNKLEGPKDPQESINPKLNKDSKDSTDSKTTSDKSATVICKPFEDLSLEKVKSLNSVSSSTDSLEGENHSKKRRRKVCKRRVGKISDSSTESIATKSNTKNSTTVVSDEQSIHDKISLIQTESISKEPSCKSDSKSRVFDSSNTLKSKPSGTSSSPQFHSKSTTKFDIDSPPFKTDTKPTDPATSDINMVCMLDKKPSKQSDKLETKANEKSDCIKNKEKSNKSVELTLTDKDKLDTKLDNQAEKIESKPSEKCAHNTDTKSFDRAESKPNSNANLAKKSKNKLETELKHTEKFDSSQTADIKPICKSESRQSKKSNISCNLSCNLTCMLDESDEFGSKIKSNEKSEPQPRPSTKSDNKVQCKGEQKLNTSQIKDTTSKLSSNFDEHPSKKSHCCNKKESKPSDKSDPTPKNEHNSTDKLCTDSKSSDKANVTSKLGAKATKNIDQCLIPQGTREPKFCDVTNLSSKSDSTNKTNSNPCNESASNQSDSTLKSDSKPNKETSRNKCDAKIDSKPSSYSFVIGKMDSNPSKKSVTSRKTESDIGTSQCELSIFRIISTRVCALSDSGESKCSSKLTIENQKSKNCESPVQSDITNKQKIGSENSVQSEDANNKNRDSCSKMPITPESDYCNMLRDNPNKDDLNVIKKVSNESVDCESKLSKCMREVKESRGNGRFCPPFEDLSSDKTKSINPVDDSKTGSSCDPSKSSSKSKSDKCDDNGECVKFCTPFEDLDTSKTKMCNPNGGKDGSGKICPPFSELSREKVKSINPVPKKGKNECSPVTRRKIETFVCPEQQTVYTVITSMLCGSCNSNTTEKSSVKSSNSKESRTCDENNTSSTKTILTKKLDQSSTSGNTPICPSKPTECRPKPQECKPKPPECKPKSQECKPKPPECKPKPQECKPKPRKCLPKSEKNSKSPAGSCTSNKALTDKSAALETGDSDPEAMGPSPADKLEQFKQNMLEAHCKTMATIKVAAEDVLCTVAKKTIEMCEDPNAMENVRKSAEELFEEVRRKTSEMCIETPPECPPGTVYEQICEKTKELCRTTKDTVSGYFSSDDKCGTKHKTKTISNSIPDSIKGFNLFNKFRDDNNDEETESDIAEPLNTLVTVVDSCAKELSERLSKLTLEFGETSSKYDQPTPRESTPKKMSLNEMGVDFPESSGTGMISTIKEKIFSIFRDKEVDKELVSMPSDHTISIERESKEDSDLEEADP